VEETAAQIAAAAAAAAAAMRWGSGGLWRLTSRGCVPAARPHAQSEGDASREEQVSPRSAPCSHRLSCRLWKYHVSTSLGCTNADGCALAFTDPSYFSGLPHGKYTCVPTSNSTFSRIKLAAGGGGDVDS